MVQLLLYLLGGFALLLLIAQIFFMVNSRRQIGREVGNIGGILGEAVRTGIIVVAYFYTPTCKVCRTQTPIVDRLAAEYDNIFSIDITEEFEMARALGIHTTPTIVIFEGGEIRDVLVGPRSEEMLREALF